MTVRVLVLSVAVVAISSRDCCLGQDGDAKIALSFTEVDLTTLVDYVSQRTDKRIIYDETLTGRVTLRTPSAITVSSLFPLLESILQFKGFTLLTSGDWLKVVQVQRALSLATRVYSPEDLAALPDQEVVITQIVELKHAGPSTDIVKAITPLLTTPGGNAIQVPAAKALVITDYATNVKKVAKIIELMDREPTRAGIRTIRLQHAKGDTLLKRLDKLVMARMKIGARSPNRIPPALDYEPATNSIIAIGIPAFVEEVERVVKELDVEGDPVETRFYPLRNVAVADAVDRLASLFGGNAGTQVKGRAANVTVDDMVIVADENTKSLIVRSTPDRHAELEDVIDKLDQPRSQVMIEAAIVEVADDDDFDLGVELQKTAAGDRGTFGFTSLGLSTTDPADMARDFAISNGFTGGLLRGGDVRVLVNALARRSKAKILSRPRLLVNDGQKATFKNVRKEPFLSTNAISTSATTTSKGGDEEAGTTLEITPTITESDYITMEIMVQSSSFQGESLDPNLPPPVQTSDVQTHVTLHDGTSLIIGGLTKVTKSDAERKVPILGDIPLIGLAFRRKSKEDRETSVYVFITPRIVHGHRFAKLTQISQEADKEAKRAEEKSDKPRGFFDWARPLVNLW